MKILSTKKQKISIDALDVELKELFLDYEIVRRIGGNVLEIGCYTFKNEEKRDAGLAIITNVPSLKMVIKKKEEGISIQSNFYEKELEITNEVFEVSDPFVEKCIKACYENLGYTFES